MTKLQKENKLILIFSWYRSYKWVLITYKIKKCYAGVYIIVPCIAKFHKLFLICITKNAKTTNDWQRTEKLYTATEEEGHIA